MVDTMNAVAVRLQNAWFQVREEERGQGLVEYALIIAIVSLGAIAALTFLKGSITGLFSKAGSSIDRQSVACLDGDSRWDGSRLEGGLPSHRVRPFGLARETGTVEIGAVGDEGSGQVGRPSWRNGPSRGQNREPAGTHRHELGALHHENLFENPGRPPVEPCAATALQSEKAQGFVEYALIIAVVGLGAIASLTFLKGSINGLFSGGGSNLSGSTSAPPAPVITSGPT